MTRGGLELPNSQFRGQYPRRLVCFRAGKLMNQAQLGRGQLGPAVIG